MHIAHRSVSKQRVKFCNKQADLKAIRYDNLDRNTTWVSTAKFETGKFFNKETISISIHQAYLTSYNISLDINCSQGSRFKLRKGVVLVWKSKTHLGQGKHILHMVVSKVMKIFILKKNLTNFQKRYIILRWTFKKIRRRRRRIRRDTMSDDMFTILVHEEKSLV